MANGFKAWLAGKLGRNEPEQPKAAPAARRAAEPYHAVTIKAGAESCEGAKQLAGVRFLSASAPRLPLPSCPEPACTCHYIHHADRRTGTDRRAAANWRRSRDSGVDRRQRKQGRRANDSIV